ncbi:MAG: PAS domain S-box protein [Geopsychrobacter sp.]|nr:PAS domain S-box protein [Geopsychrobacter sp.]
MFERAKSNSRLELINRLLRSLSSVAGLDNLVPRILEILMQTVGGDNIVLIFRLGAEWQYRDIYGEKCLYIESENPDVDLALDSGKPQRISRLGEAVPAPDGSSPIPLEDWIYPLFSHERSIGVVCMEGMQLSDTRVFDELLPFFVYAGLMLDNEISAYSKLVEANRRLQESEDLYRSLFEQSPDGIVLWSVPELKSLRFNTAAHTLLGYSREEFAALKAEDIHFSENLKEMEVFLATLPSDGLASFEDIHRTKSGAQVTVSVSLKMLVVAGQQLLLAIHRDISAQKQAEKNMALMNFALDNIHEAVYLIDESSRLNYVNEESCRAMGYSKKEITSMSIPEIGPEFPVKSWAEHWQQLKKQGTLNFESIHRHKNGRTFPVEISANYFEFDATGYNLALVRDITERRCAEEERFNLEKQILHAQKLESLGVLAGGIAHDFNNILTTIVGNAELALRRLKKESPALENLRRIEQAAERAADLAKQMLAYSGKGKFVVENIDLNILLEEMLHLLDVSISKKSILRLNPYPSLPAVEADATQIRQIIMNLVINASEAIGDKSGIIAITTGCMDCDHRYLKNVWLDENLTDGLYVYLEISDTGCGMEKAILTKLFDPFFSTKFTGRGLGMSAVLGIVRGHKGAIKVYSEPEKGTTFKILLPASSKPAEIFDNESHTDDWHGSGKVLLVDDEETIRGIGIEMLKELGFTTLTAEDGREALEKFKSHPDLLFVILDLTMPHMDGEQCFRELRQLKPDVKVIMSSGYNEQEITQKFAGKGLAGFVQKPYNLSILKQAIRQVV